MLTVIEVARISQVVIIPCSSPGQTWCHYTTIDKIFSLGRRKGSPTSLKQSNWGSRGWSRRRSGSSTVLFPPWKTSTCHTASAERSASWRTAPILPSLCLTYCPLAGGTGPYKTWTKRLKQLLPTSSHHTESTHTITSQHTIISHHYLNKTTCNNHYLLFHSYLSLCIFLQWQ